jgi:hypothetical protein
MLPVHIGIHSIEEHYIPTAEVFKIIENYFPEYEIELVDANSNVPDHKYISMVSNEYSIYVANINYSKGELEGLYISYYLNYDIEGEGEHGRIID